jgi:hypothetical protein
MIWASMTISARMPRLRRLVALLTIGACLLQLGLQLRDGLGFARAATRPDGLRGQVSRKGAKPQRAQRETSEPFKPADR